MIPHPLWRQFAELFLAKAKSEINGKGEEDAFTSSDLLPPLRSASGDGRQTSTARESPRRPRSPPRTTCGRGWQVAKAREKERPSGTGGKLPKTDVDVINPDDVGGGIRGGI